MYIYTYNSEWGLSRGIGYVKFALIEDAEKALTDGVSAEGKKLVISYAEAKKSNKSNKDDQVKEKDNNNVSTTESSTKTTATLVESDASEKQKKKQKPTSQRQNAPNDDSKTVIVTINEKVTKINLWKFWKIHSLL